MRDNCCYHEITMLSEDRVSTSVPSSVYTRIDNPDDTTSEDPFDAENERQYGLSHDNPHAVKTTTNVVILPSINKWNCFSVRDRRTVDVIGSRDNMNTATSVSPTSALEINHLFSEKVTDYPAQASRSSANDLTRNNSDYRRLTLREKLAKQRSERGKDDGNTEEPRRLTKATSLGGASTTTTNYYRPTVRSQSNDARNDNSSEEPRRLAKATSLGGAPTPPTNSRRPATRSQSNSSITEEKTVFGFKIMKGLPGSSDSRNNNSTAFTRHGSSRQPGRTTNYSTVNRFRDKTGNTLFYAPMNNRTSETTNTSEETTEPAEIRDSLKDKGNSLSSDKNIESMANQKSSGDVDKKSSDTVEKSDKDSSNMVNTTVLNIGAKGARNIYVMGARKKSDKLGNIDTKVDSKDKDENHDDEIFRVSKEIEVQNEEGKTEKLLVRAESLREGKSRLEEFREKQRRGKLTRSLTNPDFQQSENMASSKGKNVSESLAEIRERIRERRRKKGQLKKSQSMPETDSPPKQDGEENTNEFSDDAKNNLGKSKEVELNKKGSKGSEEEKGSNLNKSEYLEIEQNTKMNDNEKDENMTAMSRRCEDVIAKDNRSEEIITTNDKEEKVQDTRDNEGVVMDTVKQMGKDDSEANGSDKVISEGKKLELKEISNEKDEDQKQKVSTADAKTDVEKSVSSAVSSSDQSKSEVKKPTKRERRKRQERYQRSKTMSAIMYNEISLEARREIQHKGDDAKSGDKNGESLAIPSVSEIKKRFLEADTGSSKMSDLGLFYSGKTPASGKSPGIVKLSSRSKTAEKASVKDDSTTSKAKKSEARSRKNLSRRHTVAIGTTLTQDENMNTRNTDLIGMNNQNTESFITDKKQTTETKAKIPLGRRHTLPSYKTEISVHCNNGHSSVNHAQKDVSESGSRLPVRRHTFCSGTSFMVSRHKTVKLPDSVETLREKFSKGGAPVFNLATSSKDSSTKAGSDVDSDERTRKRVVSDSTVKRIIEEAKILKDVNKERGSSLSRRHTIATRPKSEDSEKDEQERHEILDKFLAKDDEIEKSQKSEKKTITKDVESKTVEDDPISKRTKKDKEEKLSVLKLRRLFHGQASNTEKKTKLRERRATTIGGSISPDIVKELDIKNKDSNNKYVDLYVNDTTCEEAKEDKTERRRRSSDLNPDSYLSSKPLSSEETGKDSVFSDDNAQPENSSSNVETSADSTSQPAFTRRRSVSDSDMKIASGVSVREQNSSQNQVQFSSDVIDLKTPTETNLSVLDPARRRSGSESDLSRAHNGSGKDQNLDDYLTTAIKTLTESPKSQRTSPQGSPHKETFTASLDQSEERHETKRHLDVVKSNLSMHSWSTSDLDKLIHGGDGVRSSMSQVDISTMDFDEISSSTTRLQSLTEGRTKVRPKRTSSKTLNPMKSLMERTDVRTHTEQPEEENKPASGFEKAKKRSNPRKKRSQLEPWRRHTLDPVALAALASREDFSRVSLRRTKGPGKEKDEYDGSLPVMLIQIKGRRQVQTRLVEPSLSSLNTGDCFILVTTKELFCWIGKHANTIEKAKAVEISSKIQKRGDMNCKTGDVLYIDETKQGNTLAYRKFCKILEGEADFPIEDAKMCPDDEFYEREVISTNKVYKMQEGEPPHLIPVTELCGYMPRIGILNTKEVFVFDFGSELYVWTGQQSLSNKRKVAFHLAEMLYKQQFDSSDGVVSPIDPRRAMKRSQSSQPIYHDAEGKKCGRPKWTLFAKLHEKAETLLFQEKFFDWPDPTKIIRMKGHISSGEIPERPPPVELKPCDPTDMQKPASDLEPAILEATNLGRGLGTPNIEVNGEVKEGDLVTTLGMTVWLVTQNKHFVLPKPSEGHFHSGDGYVIRWVYFVAKNRTVRDRRGRIRPLTGRQRCAYFFWQGNECSVNEKGAAAIMAVELDEEHGPQIRVVEGKEPPHFLKLFDGAMVIHSGKRVRVSEEQDDFSDKSTVRMYCIRNEDISEGCLVQVKRSTSSLRSRSSFVIVDSEKGNVFVWHGCKTNEYHRKSAEKAANFIKEKHPVEMNLSEEVSVSVTEIEEGLESDVFWSTVSGKKNSYLSLLNDPLNYDFCPRLFHMTSSTGQFTSTEILSSSRYLGRTCPFPVLQDDLHSASQPATFLLDVGDEMYVWEGWMPAEITKDKRGSAKRRWDKERKLTLQTTLSYIEAANERITKGAYVVQAGLEPSCFTTHFPFWNRRQSIAEIQRKEGKKDGEKKPIEKALEALTKKFYSFKELTSDNPPDGVDPSKLETYLTDEDFEENFQMPRDLFGLFPGWKQDILKKAFGLF